MGHLQNRHNSLFPGRTSAFPDKSYWSKDIMFVVTDNEHFGAKAWVEAYHGITSQRAHGNIFDWFYVLWNRLQLNDNWLG